MAGCWLFVLNLVAQRPRETLVGMAILDKIEEVGPDRKKITDALGKVVNYDSIIGPVTRKSGSPPKTTVPSGTAQRSPVKRSSAKR